MKPPLPKALTTIEGVGRHLSPEFEMIPHIAPFARKVMRQQISPKKLASDVYFSALELGAMLRDLPSEVREIVALVKRGKIEMEFEHRGLEHMLEIHDQISNRIAVGTLPVTGSAAISSAPENSAEIHQHPRNSGRW